MEIMNPTLNPEGRRAFTIVELLVVILIIGILVAFLFPAFQGVLERAKKVQAKNDLTQIVTAVNAFYTEYGRYPIDPAAPIADASYGATGATYTNDKLFDVLRNITTDSLTTTLNPRQIVFISPPNVTNGATPRSGIGTTTSIGQYFDPWGTAYNVAIDGNYNNIVKAPAYTDLTPTYATDPTSGDVGVRTGVIAWSLGKNLILGGGTNSAPPKPTEGGSNGVFSGSGDVISWQ
jgi:prepilin-type N-terminal cleavage/methylation domain-containing protein